MSAPGYTCEPPFDCGLEPEPALAPDPAVDPGLAQAGAATVAPPMPKPSGASAAAAPTATPADAVDSRRYLNADPQAALDDDGATPDDVMNAIDSLLETAFEMQRLGVEQAFADLAVEPPRAGRSGWLKLVEIIAETVISAGLGQIGQRLVAALSLTDNGAKELTSAVKHAMGSFARVASAGAAGHGITPDSRGSGREIFDEYRLQTMTERARAQGLGRAQLHLSASKLKRLPAASLHQLLVQLESAAQAARTLVDYQHDEVLRGWTLVCAEAALGPRPEGGTAVPGANDSGEQLSNDQLAAALSPGTTGFLDILIQCPWNLDGMSGCRVELARINSHPAVADVLRKSDQSLASLPLYRKVFISSVNDARQPMWAGPSFAITPAGEVEILPAATSALSGIGSFAKVEEIASQPNLDFVGRESPEGREQRIAFERRKFQLQAMIGAGLVMDLLARTPVKDVIG